MSVAFQYFDQTSEDFWRGVHNFDTPGYKVMLTNTAPVAGNKIKTDLTEISTGHGYSAGGNATTVTLSISGHASKIVCTDVVFTASGGTIGPFRYAILWNDTPTSPVDPLLGFWDYGSSITLNDTETFTVDFDGSTGVATLDHA